MPFFYEPLIILVLAIGIDLLLGEPPRHIHPTVWMGNVTAFLKSKIQIRGALREKLKGVLLVLVVIALFSLPTRLLLDVLSSGIGPIMYIIAGALIFKTTFAIKSMRDHVLPVVQALKEGSTDRARQLVQRVVRRDTSTLGERHLVSATVETIAEGTVDGITSPLFYFAILGVPGAVAYRAVNTLDSAVGYRDSEYMNIGWASAKLDTLLNFLPARITAMLMVLAAYILGEDWRNAWRILRRDSGKTESVNAGWPMSTMAGALNVQLEKLGHYVLGDDNEPLTPEHIVKALKIMHLTTLLFTAMLVLPLCVIVGWVV
jgi:adenosylcobinamide-phosphate synthase